MVAPEVSALRTDGNVSYLWSCDCCGQSIVTEHLGDALEFFSAKSLTILPPSICSSFASHTLAGLAIFATVGDDITHVIGNAP